MVILGGWVFLMGEALLYGGGLQDFEVEHKILSGMVFVLC